MGSLASMQTTFTRHLAKAAPSAPAFVLSARGSAARRFGVYRNNVFAGLVGVLEDRFPATRRITGEEFFAGFAREFVERHPPRSPALVFYGGAFADVIRSAPECDDVPYLADVAAIEWEIHRCYHAADEPVLQARDLGRASADPSGLTFRLAASTGFVASEYPAYSLWRMNASAEPDGPVLLAKVGESALITRLDYRCHVEPLGPGGGTFVAQLASGRTLADAAAAATSVSSDFRLDQTLGLLLRQGALAALSATRSVGYAP